MKNKIVMDEYLPLGFQNPSLFQNIAQYIEYI